MEELLEDLVVTKDYGLRFAAEEPKVNQSDLCHGYFVIHRLLVLLAILVGGQANARETHLLPVLPLPDPLA